MRRTYGVLGDAVNLSARLMQAAAPAQILASIEVYQALANEFIWETLPTIQVKGKNEAVAVYGLLASKSQQAQRENVTQNELPMVGRERELAQIKERLDLAAQGRGQIVGVTAEPGMGKSRLIAEVVRLADRQGWLRYEGECSSSGTNTSYQVWHTIWRQFYELDPSWPLPVQIRTLQAQLAQIDPTFPHRLPLLGAAVNLPIPDNELTAAFDAKLRKSSLEALLVDCLRAKSQHGPILIVLEDCHWLDPLSHDLLDVVGKAIVDLPVLVLLAFRSPQLQYLREPRVSALAHYVGIDLASFTPEEARQLIELKLARNYGSAKPIPAELVERIYRTRRGQSIFCRRAARLPQDSRRRSAGCRDIGQARPANQPAEPDPQPHRSTRRKPADHAESSQHHRSCVRDANSMGLLPATWRRTPGPARSGGLAYCRPNRTHD